MAYASQQLKEIKGIRLVGTAKEKTSIVSFIIESVNALDAGMYLDTLGVAVRTFLSALCINNTLLLIFTSE